MRILILGASGQIGSAFFEIFSKSKDDEVYGTSRKASGENRKKFDPFKDPWEILGKYDVVLNCVGVIKATKEFSFEKIHMGMTELIISNRTLIGNPKLIQMSVLGADSGSDIEFLKTKGLADSLLLKEENTVVVRPSIVCTHRTMLVKKLLMLKKLARISGGRMIVPKGFPDHKIQPVLIDDLASLLLNIAKLEVKERIICATGPEEVSFRSLLMKAVPGIKLIEIPESVVRFFVKNILSVIFPDVINFDQYRLLFKDNIASSYQTKKYLMKELTSTEKFWKDELEIKNKQQ
jgi:uncharacterized protein YbjT (DUF2867 family)